jgi:uncharacterized membrane protein
VDAVNPYVRPGGPGFGRTFLEPGHGPGVAHPLEWAIFALVLALLLLTIANVAFAYAGRASRRGRWVPRGGRPAGPPPDPLAVLSGRYARGEIGRDDFLRATDDLRGEPRPAPSGGDEPTLEQPPGS